MNNHYNNFKYKEDYDNYSDSIDDHSITDNKSRVLSDELVKAIIQSIISSQNLLTFQQVCNEDIRLFGKPGSTLRLKVQQKHKRLLRLKKADPVLFAKTCKSYEVIALSSSALEQISQIPIQVEAPKSGNFIMSNSKHFLAGGSKCLLYCLIFIFITKCS